MIKEHFISSLSDYFNVINLISKDCSIEDVMYNNLKESKVLWFRGQEQNQWALLPSLYRYILNCKEGYSPETLKTAEMMRLQHYAAKNTHQMPFSPQNQLEWLEVMQHYGTKTRLLDWSESSIHALLVSLEPILDLKKCNKCGRIDFSPVVWVLSPQILNKEVAKKFRNTDELISGVLNHLNLSLAESTILSNEVRKSAITHIDEMKKSTIPNIRYIYNLSDIINDLQNRGSSPSDIKHGGFYPIYFYTLLQYYYLGKITKIDDLPPLAIIQPYHNERIRTQRGVFTLFPVYDKPDGINKNSFDFDKMTIADRIFHKIIISHPDQIVDDLSKNGIHRSWLYPEMEIVAGEIEDI